MVGGTTSPLGKQETKYFVLKRLVLQASLFCLSCIYPIDDIHTQVCIISINFCLSCPPSLPAVANVRSMVLVYPLCWRDLPQFSFVICRLNSLKVFDTL